MSLSQSTQSPTVLAAIDIVKLRHEVLFEVPDWRSRERLVWLNTVVQFRRFTD